MNLTSDIPNKFINPEDALDNGKRGKNAYLRHLAFQGEKNRYPELMGEVSERLNFELQVIEKIGYPEYFLIVQDFMSVARRMRAFVGPGRGSAAGSLVNYCLGITNVDPIKHNLLFERFLNPARISIPDIDIDFEEEGKKSVIQYLIRKYGSNQVAQIMTYKTETIKYIVHPSGTELEGSFRNAVLRAGGVIIAPNDIRQFFSEPLLKDSEMWCTPLDAEEAESAGLLKMDFFDLKSLSLIKEALKIIKNSHRIELIPDYFPLEDELTYQLFQRGETEDVFQFESTEMQNYLRELKPTKFSDLVAIIALYRPGSINYIPSFIKLKHEVETITYDLEGMDKVLSETYGMTIYQEQVMLLSQKLADFTKGESDVLRKAMAKKQMEVLDIMLPMFIENGKKNGHNENKLIKVWNDWKVFAPYAFNKSHATCYSMIAYQTAHLKAHYPLEFRDSVLRSNKSDIKSEKS